MRVTGDEEVAGAGRYGGSQHAPLRRAQVLRLVDHHMPEAVREHQKVLAKASWGHEGSPRVTRGVRGEAE
ncbi:hypothetical protein ACGFKZ_08315 [Micromonospora tulbaghiae]|uniref:hypothetical protein n=1 Tax=Micromonospora TaxID=1873 RepID=UPI0033CD24B5